MTTTYIGSLSVGDTMPGAVAVGVAGVAGINGALPDILARLAALQAFAPQPVDFQAQLLLAQQTVAGIQLGISMGLPVPDISAQIAEVLALISSLLATVTMVNAQLTVITDFQALLGAAGIHGYRFIGPTNQMGSELSTALSGGVPGGAPTDAAQAVVFITTVPATFTALGQILKVAP